MIRTALYRCREGAARIGPLARCVAFRAIESLLPAGSGWTRRAIDRAVGSGEAELLVLVRQGAGMPATVCGCVFWRTIVPEAEILQVVVRHAWRGRRHGSEMLAATIDIMRISGVREVFLEVASGNRPALALYRSAGFRATGRRTWYYGRQDAVLMRSALLPRSGYVNRFNPMRTGRQKNCDENLLRLSDTCIIQYRKCPITRELEDPKHG